MPWEKERNGRLQGDAPPRGSQPRLRDHTPPPRPRGRPQLDSRPATQGGLHSLPRCLAGLCLRRRERAPPQLPPLNRARPSGPTQTPRPMRGERAPITQPGTHFTALCSRPPHRLCCLLPSPVSEESRSPNIRDALAACVFLWPRPLRPLSSPTGRRDRDVLASRNWDQRVGDVLKTTQLRCEIRTDNRAPAKSRRKVT